MASVGRFYVEMEDTPVYFRVANDVVKPRALRHFFMKEYHKSLQAYEQGLKLDPENQDAKTRRTRRCYYMTCYNS